MLEIKPTGHSRHFLLLVRPLNCTLMDVALLCDIAKTVSDNLLSVNFFLSQGDR